MRMAVTAGAVYVGAVAATAAILAATREEALLDGPAYIRDAEPEGITRRVGLALARQTCRAYADGNTDVTPARAAQFENACRPYLDSVGYGTGPTFLKPFEGGQCVERYIVTYTLDSGGTNPQTGTALTVGPIRGLEEVDGSTGNKLVFLLSNSGVVFNGLCFNIIGPSGPTSTLLGSYTPGSGGGTSTIDSIQACGADNCGGPSPVVTEPEPPDDPDAPFQPIIVVPIFNVDGTVNVNLDGTVDITIDGVEFNIDPFGGGGGGGNGGVGPGDLVPDGGLAGAPADTGNGGVASGEAPPGQELVGVRVEVLESPIGANQYSNNAAVVYRGIGYVRMGYSARLALDVGASAVISPQFFIAPVRGLTNWEHRANNGFINRVTPFYRELPS